jgi:hypothetical protein
LSLIIIIIIIIIIIMIVIIIALSAQASQCALRSPFRLPHTLSITSHSSHAHAPHSRSALQCGAQRARHCGLGLLQGAAGISHPKDHHHPSGHAGAGNWKCKPPHCLALAGCYELYVASPGLQAVC